MTSSGLIVETQCSFKCCTKASFNTAFILGFKQTLMGFSSSITVLLALNEIMRLCAYRSVLTARRVKTVYDIHELYDTFDCFGELKLGIIFDIETVDVKRIFPIYLFDLFDF